MYISLSLYLSLSIYIYIYRLGFARSHGSSCSAGRAGGRRSHRCHQNPPQCNVMFFCFLSFAFLSYDISLSLYIYIYIYIMYIYISRLLSVMSCIAIR